MMGGVYIAAANNEANDFPVFCADNYPVDPSTWYKVSGFCKECSLGVFIPMDYLTFPFQYHPLSYTDVSWGVLCEDL